MKLGGGGGWGGGGERELKQGPRETFRCTHAAEGRVDVLRSE